MTRHTPAVLEVHVGSKVPGRTPDRPRVTRPPADQESGMIVWGLGLRVWG